MTLYIQHLCQEIYMKCVHIFIVVEKGKPVCY